MSTTAWEAQEWAGDTDPWKFCIVDPKCACGWFLSAPAPVMGATGVQSVEGECKRHGHVTAATWNIFDNYPESM